MALHCTLRVTVDFPLKSSSRLLPNGTCFTNAQMSGKAQSDGIFAQRWQFVEFRFQIGFEAKH